MLARQFVDRNMPNFLYSAINAHSQPVQGFIEAPGSRQAMDALRARGLTSVALHQEAAIATSSSELHGLSQAQLSELARLRLTAMRKPGLPQVLLEVARLHRFWLLADAALFAYAVHTGSRQMLWGACLAAVFPFVWGAWQFRHGDRYLQLVKSYSIGDWSRVQQLAAKLQQRSESLPSMAFDLAVRLACIKARQGALEEAVRSLQDWRLRPELLASPGMFECRLASVYAAAGDRQSFVRLMGESFEVSAHDPSRTMDYALALARFGDVHEAERQLAQVETELLPPHASGFIGWTKGLIALRRGQSDASILLGAAVAEFLKLSTQPAVWTALAFCTCDHAISLKLTGQQDKAINELAQVWPIVKAHADKALLKLLKADGLLPATNS